MTAPRSDQRGDPVHHQVSMRSAAVDRVL